MDKEKFPIFRQTSSPLLRQLSFTAANRQFWLILLVGLALGVANYALGVYDTLGRSLVLQVFISILIGYPLLVLAQNAGYGPVHLRGAMEDSGKLKPKAFILVLLACFVIGILATEGQRLADHLLFAASFTPGTAGGIYLFNGILSAILGLMTVRWHQGQQPAAPTVPEVPEPVDPLTKIPFRKGEKTILLPLDEVTYFEAYDNYAFLHTISEERHLCNYSLAQLSARLPKPFCRIHRKYLVNTDQVTSITPHLKGRYVLTLGPSGKQSIRSSSSYAETVRDLLKL